MELTRQLRCPQQPHQGVADGHGVQQSGPAYRELGAEARGGLVQRVCSLLNAMARHSSAFPGMEAALGMQSHHEVRIG